MTLSEWGAVCFGLVVGWITYRTLRRREGVAALSDIATGDRLAPWLTRASAVVAILSPTYPARFTGRGGTGRTTRRPVARRFR
jgi:hypothetical protein